MGLHIEFTTDYSLEKSAMQQLEEAMAALGFVRKASAEDYIKQQIETEEAFREVVSRRAPDAQPKTESGPDTRGQMNVGLEHAEHDAEAERAKKEEVRAKNARNLAGTIEPVERAPNPDYTHPSGRKFGEPGPGGKRRTKAEMAEDNAYLAALDNQTAAAEEEIPNAEAEAAEAEMMAEYAEQGGFEPDDDAQDAADEAAEAAAEKPTDGALTLEDLRRVIGDYAKKHGIPKAQASIPLILGAPMLEVTDFETAIMRVKLATVTSDGLLHEADVPTALPATKDDLMTAVMAYAAKYEGKGVKPASGGPTAVDLADVMRKTFPGTSGALSEIPATPEGYGKALAAVNAAITGNPFKRDPK